jgi:hypothetical protein
MERQLTDDEKALASSVFYTSLPPWDRIIITDSLGAQNRPWTNGFSCDMLNGTGAWYINLGPSGYTSALVPFDMQKTLIHEVTHVWQGYNSIFCDAYMYQSLWAQFANDDAYAYTRGLRWTDYNVEQQAQIVEDWFANGMSNFDALFIYIDTNIRPGLNS